ncbi:hypothetical protein Golax_015030 [Gossypium laxum]|uniref:RNase H type-1 domain-containing protein n=1 Tax=Gossypium laxum TaxID=34288 RepID=A0A7J8ZWK4_9ROSI|nr:hypothetical protein [Gossypium laxum]
MGMNVKVNFDAAFDKQHNKSCIGIVIRNSSGQLLKVKVYNNEYILTTFAAKALTCVQAIRFGVELGFLRVEVKGRQTNKVTHIIAKERLNEDVNTYLANGLSNSVVWAVEDDRQGGRGGDAFDHKKIWVVDGHIFEAWKEDLLRTRVIVEDEDSLRDDFF